MTEIDEAIHWWLSENCTKNKEILGDLRPILMHFFYCADSMIITLKKPIFTSGGIPGKMSSEGKWGIYIINNLSPKEFSRLRGLLSLMGDMVMCIRQAEKSASKLDNNSLSNILVSHSPNLQKYQDVRNYFTHLDERIGRNRMVHGVTGKLIIPGLNLEFKDEAEGCFYLGYVGDTIYFHDKREKGPNKETTPSPKSFSINQVGLSDLFLLAEEIYNLLTTHNIHARKYPRFTTF